MMQLQLAPLIKILFVFLRLSSLFIFSPIEAIRNLPNSAKLFLLLGLSFIIALPLQVSQLETRDLFLSALTECANGLLLSLPLYACFAIFQLAGYLIDTQIGLNPLAILNPSGEGQESLSSRLLLMLALLFFFSTQGHHQLIQTLNLSFKLNPPGEGLFLQDLHLLSRQFSLFFQYGFQLSAPILACLFILDLTAAFITRNLAQVGTYFLLLPVKILLGFFLLACLLNELNPWLESVFQAYFPSSGSFSS